MTALDLYERFNLPHSLRLHQLRVTKLVDAIANTWYGPTLQRDLLVCAALVHDLGNIVKFDLTNFAHVLGDQANQADYWREEQKLKRQQYGSDAHAATLAMLVEAKVPERPVSFLAEINAFSKKVDFSQASWEQKIIYYADSRTGPFGYLTLAERAAEILKRYAKDNKKDYYQKIFEITIDIEKELMSHITGDLIGLTNALESLPTDRYLKIKL